MQNVLPSNTGNAESTSVISIAKLLDSKRHVSRQVAIEDAARFTPHWVSELQENRSDKELKKLIASIEQCGQMQPILVSDGRILDGRHRMKAMLALAEEGKVNSVHVTDVGSLSDEEAKVIASTLTTTVRYWDPKDRAAWAAKYIAATRLRGDSSVTVESIASQLCIKKRTLESYMLRNKTDTTNISKPVEKSEVESARDQAQSLVKLLIKNACKAGDSEQLSRLASFVSGELGREALSNAIRQTNADKPREERPNVERPRIKVKGAGS